jgi:ABC-2 type transport system ATP-binding protein
LDEVQKICSHVAVLQKGKKLFDGKVSEVLAISDSFELASDNLERLTSLVRLHPDCQSVTQGAGTIQVYFSKEVNPGELNQFFFQQGVTLTRLAERKRSLEQHFLELLDNNK